MECSCLGLDTFSQAAVGEFQALVSPLGMARVVLRLSPYRRRPAVQEVQELAATVVLVQKRDEA